MTRILKIRFRRLIVVAAMSAGALGLAVGLAGTASAATTGNIPTPATTAPCPCSTAPVPVVYHKPPPPPKVTHCFNSLEVEHDTLAGQAATESYGQGGYGQPQTYAYFGGQPQARGQATVEVVQLVQVCVTEQRGHPDTVKVCDETGPYAWVIPADGFAPTPTGLPADVKGLLAA